MKNIVKYISVLSVVLLLGSFSVVSKTYGASSCGGSESIVMSDDSLSKENVGDSDSTLADDIQTLRIKMNDKVSDWIRQIVDKDEVDGLINGVYAQTTYTTKTDLGYSNTSVSGLELNNPVPVEVRYSDSDGVNDMEALYFWMTRTGIVPKQTNLPRYIDTIGDGSNARTKYHSSFGFMVRRSGDTWSDAEIYIPENVTAGDYWVKISDFGNNFFIYGPTGLAMVKISNIELSAPSSSVLVLNFDMEFLNEYSGVEDYERVYEGTYNTYTMVNDVFGFTPWDNYTYGSNVDLDNLRNYFSENEIRYYDDYQNMNLQWLVDLTAPEVETVRVSVTGDNQLAIYWKVNDGQTGLGYVVGNVYRDISSGGTTDSIEYLSPDEEKTYTIPVFDENKIGSLEESSLWKIPYLGSVSMNAERTETVDILGNTKGFLDFYVTVFDKGGNYNILNDSISLSSWLISKGGLVYSTGGTNVAVRLLDFSEGDGWPEGLWYSPDRDKYPDVEVFDPDLADLSSEVLAGNVNYDEDLYDLPHSVPINGVYNISVKVLQEIGLLRNNIYLTYKDRAESQLSAIGAETIPISDNTTFAGKGSSYCDAEYCIVNTIYNLTFDSGFICDTKMLFLTSGNITVRPNLMNEHNTDGCIFIAGGNIVIEEGTYASEGSTTPKYDIVEGYFLADGTILIEAGDVGLSVKDGLQINGGLIAFGGTQSVVIERDMKLKDKAMYPALAIHAASGYGKISLKFFGPERSVYKQEVGYKPF